MAKRSAPATRVLIADDHAYTRAGIRMALEQAGFEVCAEAATGRTAVEHALAAHPDVALLDVHMPDGSGVWAAYEITAALPETAVVMLTFSHADDDLFDSLRAGACGYLLKDMEPDRLGQSLRSVVAGEVVLPRSLMSRVADELRGRKAAPGAARGDRHLLTERESEVADLLRTGATTEEIAAALSMSPATVRVHISSVVKKLRVRDRAEAAALLSSTHANGRRS